METSAAPADVMPILQSLEKRLPAGVVSGIHALVTAFFSHDAPKAAKVFSALLPSMNHAYVTCVGHQIDDAYVRYLTQMLTDMKAKRPDGNVTVSSLENELETLRLHPHLVRFMSHDVPQPGYTVHMPYRSPLELLDAEVAALINARQ